MSERASVESGVISIAGLARRFGLVQAVHPLSVRIGPGGITGLLGPNGSGKSTLLRMLIGLVRPDAGDAAVDGARLAGDGLAIRRRVAYLCGEIHAYGELTGRAHLAWCLRGRGRAALARAQVQGAGGLLVQELALAQEELALAGALDLAEVVRGEQDRRPALGVPAQELQHLSAARGVEPFGRLVEHAHAHLGRERRGQQELALHAVAVPAHAPSQGQLESPGDLQRARQALRVQWVSAPEPRELERALAGLGAIETHLSGTRATFFFPGEREGDHGAGRACLRALLEASALPEPRSIAYGELPLAELYRELYGVEGV